ADLSQARQARPTKRCSEPEPAGSLRDKSNVSGGWPRSLTYAFDTTMKARSLFSLVVAGLLTCSAQTSTKVSSIVLAKGRFQRDSSEVARELPRALESAVLVMDATVLDGDSSVKATVGTPQGWRAALVKPTSVLKGNRQPEAVWVANMGFRIDGLHW